MWFNYLPINDRSKTATISSYHFGNGAKGYASIVASGFIKSGGNASQLLRADGGVATFNWSGQSGQPTWLWGGNSQHSYYVYNPSNFRVAYAASADNSDKVDGYHATDGRTFNGNINWSSNWNDTWSDGTNKHPWYGFDNRYSNTGAYSTTISDYHGMTIKTANTLRLDCKDLLINGTNISNLINNYYWANIKISTSANTQTTPSVNTIYANNWFRSQGASGWYSESYGGGIHMSDTTWIRTYGNKSFYCDRQIYSSSSIRMSDILLERTNEINNITNGPLHLNYRNTGNVTLCNGGGAVTIGTTSTDIGGNKLFVNGSEFIDGASNVRQHVFAKGFRHRDHNSNDAVLLAGGGYSQGVPVKYWAIYSIYIGGSSTDNSYYKLSGNYNFISNMTWEQLGSAILNINFPSGYNKGNTLIFGNGDHMMDTNWSTPVYVTITTNRRFGQASNIRVMISDDSSFNTGFASIYFMCMG